MRNPYSVGEEGELGGGSLNRVGCEDSSKRSRTPFNTFNNSASSSDGAGIPLGVIVNLFPSKCSVWLIFFPLF